MPPPDHAAVPVAGDGVELVAWRRLESADDTAALGAALGARLRAGDIVVLAGELGAGKTTLTAGLAERLGVRGPVTSPTFVISRIHPSLVGGPDLVHVDAYRLADAAELDDLDLDADVPESVTVVEWGSGLAEQLADSHVRVELVRSTGGPDPVPGVGEDGEPPAGTRAQHPESDLDGPDPRLVRITGHGPRWISQPPLAVAP